MTRSKPFYFKEFEVYQDNSPLKLGTDAVLLGSWAMYERASSILDVGTGCGIIALMMAQRCPQAMITGIDIQKGCLIDAVTNFKRSPWKHHLRVLNLDFKSFEPEEKFDLIVSNPPYFDGTYISGDTEKDRARHTGDLDLKALMQNSKRLLHANGSLQIVLPYELTREAIWQASLAELYPSRICNVITKKGGEAERVLIEFQNDSTASCEETELYIRESGSARQNLNFRKMLESYYVYM